MDNEQDRERAQLGVEYSAAEGDGDRGSLLVRCASQSSLDESSQRPAGGLAGPEAAPAHAGKLLEALSRLRRDATLCDVIIQAQAECSSSPSAGVPAHRAVLAAASPYFLAMFTQFGEREQPSVTIQNIEPSALEAIIEYIYTPESLVITEDSVQGLLAGASLVQVWGVRAACCGFLAGALAPDNALGIRAFAELHACADLAHAAARYIDLHAAQVLETEEFLALEPDVLCQLLDSDRITVPNEEVILDAVIRWMKHDAEVYAVGGFNGTLRVRSVDVYDAAADSWSAGPPLTARRSTLGVAVLGDVIYAVGGFDGVTGLNSAEALDTSEGAAAAWRPVAPMSTRRSSVGVCVLAGRLYAVGGYDGAHRQCLHTVERYDPATDAWEPCAEMSARRSGAGVGAVGGALYAVGGHDGPAVRRSVERLDPAAGAWALAPPMHTARRNAAVAAYRGKLYVVGGDDGAANLDTVEVYDPATETWTVLPERMSVGRSYAGLAVVERPA